VVATVQQAHPQDTVELWAEDEHRLGLKPVLRRMWALKGHRPIATVHPRYEWLYVYGFVQPQSGETHWLIVPTVGTEVFSQALALFAREVGAGPGKQVIVVLDQAGWHVSAKVAVPNGIHLVPLPAYSPELQPAERLWPLTNEPIANRPIETLDDLDALLGDRCVALQEQPTVIRAHTCFHWWPRLP
jgi:hypothetical protein